MRALAAVLGMVLVGPVRAEDQAVASKRTIAVTGQGEVQAVPDRVVVSFAVETTAARAGEAAAENAKRSAAVSAALKAKLAAEDTVTTSRYVIEPRYDTTRTGEPREPRITGYVARNEVTVESRQIEQVGALVDTAIGAGANRVGGLQFTLAKRADALHTVLEKAGAEARAQAESVARGLGVRLKGVLSASTGAVPVLMPRRFEMAAMSADRATTPIEPGELTVSATLQVTYEIE